MGAQTAALFARAGVPVVCASRSQEKSAQAIAALCAKEPALAERLSAISYQELPAAVADCDWIVEALGEDLKLKRSFYEMIDRHRGPRCIVSTVTSGLSIAALAEGFSVPFQQHFLGTHLFNPPAKLRACERIAHARTRPDLVEFVDEFLRGPLQRIVIPALDVPAFAGNRIGFHFLNQAARAAEARGVLEVDTLLGGYTGRALPPLATIDLVGLDVHRAIVDNVFWHAAHDCRECFRVPEFLEAMIGRGQLGRKTPAAGGFYGPRTNGARSVWNPRQRAHETPPAPEFGFVAETQAALREGDPAAAQHRLFGASDPAAAFVQYSLANYVHYAFARVGDVTPAADGIHGIDAVMAHGFCWVPPGAFVDLWGGPAAAVRTLAAHGFNPPAALQSLPEGEPVCRIPDAARLFAA
jgi:3-hydroxyacyl-CoA dehydrogenase